MRQGIAELLTEDMGEVRSQYSGRGMNGEETAAVVYDSEADFRRALVFAAFQVGRDFDDPESALDELLTLSTDSMGLGIVVY